LSITYKKIKTPGLLDSDSIFLSPIKKATVFFENYEKRSLREIESGIKSLKKQIFKHRDCIENPTKYYPDFYTFDPRRQRHLIEVKWLKDIARQQEYLNILVELSKLKK
jgi:hypothetical protein